jgi:FPC/CPF motif-containing protein YcgG
MKSDELIINEYSEFLRKKDFPCVAAKAALSRNHIQCMVASHMACPADDKTILQFLYSFVDMYRASEESYHSAAVIFKEPVEINETLFDTLLWQRLNSLASLDKQNYTHDLRVDSDPNSPRYSFSLKEEAFFILGLHPGSSRRSRQFKHAALVFNPHAEFEKLRNSDRYTRMKEVVRKRDVEFSGSVNPMLADFGEASEVYQYSGTRYNTDWTCPLRH